MSVTGILSTAGWQQKASTVTTGTLKSILLLPDSREFRPILIRRPEALSSAYRRPRGSDSAPISSQKEARSSSILRATPSPASQLRNVRLPVCLPTALVPIFHFSGMSPCAPNIVVWCTAHRTLVWQRSIPMQSLIQRNRQRESYSGSERGNA